MIKNKFFFFGLSMFLMPSIAFGANNTKTTNQNKVALNNQSKNVKTTNTQQKTSNNKAITQNTQTTTNKVAKQQENKPVKKEPLIHIVQDGETVYRISLNYQISQADLVRLNDIKNNNIWVGQKLIMPDNAVKPDDSNIEKQQTKEEQKTAQAQNQVIDTTKVSLSQQADIVNQVDISTFLWPARGTIISKFGHLTNSGRLEGVNIAMEKGAIIRATASGEVVYNDKVEGYDNVILIRHYNGFISAYGHTDPLVVVGDKIKKGQVIGYVVQNKQSKRSILYFSIRKNKKSYDPEKIIPVKISE